MLLLRMMMMILILILILILYLVVGPQANGSVCRQYDHVTRIFGFVHVSTHTSALSTVQWE